MDGPCIVAIIRKALYWWERISYVSLGRKRLWNEADLCNKLLYLPDDSENGRFIVHRPTRWVTNRRPSIQCSIEIFHLQFQETANTSRKFHVEASNGLATQMNYTNISSQRVNSENRWMPPRHHSNTQHATIVKSFRTLLDAYFVLSSAI